MQIHKKNWIMKHVSVNVKIIINSWNPSTCVCENNKNLKSIADTSVIEDDEVISIMNIVSTKMTNTIAKNVSKNSDYKTV